MNDIDLRSLWAELDQFEAELDKEGKVLQDIWIKIATLKSSNDKEFERLKASPEFDFLPADTLVVLNVGGQITELSAEELTRDPASLLAALCRRQPLDRVGSREAYFIDRDWWLFRHIVNYLRHDSLPSELETLKELYREASYFRLSSLQHAIEQIPAGRINSQKEVY